MRTKPSLPYCGITIILDEPSRFDIKFGRLLSGPCDDWFNSICFKSAAISLGNCDLRTCDCPDPLLDTTRGIILGGEKSVEKYSNGILDPPGYSTIAWSRYPALPIFYPQDCLDFRSMRGNVDFSEDDVTDRDSKEKTPTRRKNYRFWNQWHINKFLSSTNTKYHPPKLDERLYPRIGEAVEALTEEDEILYLDIETSRIHRCLTCIGFSTGKSFPKVYVVPVYLTSGRLAYGEFHKFFRALSFALSRCEVVIHNSMFDLMVLHGFYKMCLPSRVYDTMIAQHRCFPEAEKSLAHTISCWTDQPYHKDIATEVFNLEGEKVLWSYNAKDVYNLKLIKDAQMRYAYSIPGLMESISQGNASIIPYLVTSLHGLRLDSLKLSTTHIKLEKKKNLFAKMASILVGKTFNPASTQQCSAFFHRTLNYPVISKTSKGSAALGSKQLYQLQLKHQNPLIPVILKYREAAKDASSLETELFELP